MNPIKPALRLSLLAATVLLSSEELTLEPISTSETPITVSSEGIGIDRPTSLPRSGAILEEVITRETIEALNPSDVYDVLQYASSVFIQRQGRKAPAFAKVRGNRSLGIIIDGVYIPGDVTSRIMATLPVETIERIRIVRDSSTLNLGPLPNGTGGLLGGDDAGYLVIETKTPSKTLEGLAALQIESHDRRHGSVMGGGVSDFGYLSVLADYDQREEDDQWGFEKKSLYGKGGLFFGALSLELQGFITDSSKELSRSTSPGVEDSKWIYDPIKIGEFSLRAAYDWGEGVTTLQYAHSDVRMELQQRSWSKPQAFKLELQKEKFDHIRFDHAHKLGSHTLRAGVEQIFWNTPTGEYFYVGWERKERTTGAFVQDEWHEGSLSIDAGLRIDQTGIDKGYEQIGKNKVLVEDETRDPVMAAALGTRWDALEGVSLYGRSRLGSQNAPEVETQDGSELPSSNRMEFEAGVDTALYSWLKPRLSLYYVSVKDSPVVVSQRKNPDDPTDLINIYDGKDWIEQGAELAVAGLYDGFSYQLSYSYNTNDDETMDNRIPQSTLNGVLNYTLEGITASAGVAYIDTFEAVNAAGTGEAGGYTNIDFSLAYAFDALQLRHKAMLYARNLTDDNYESVYGFPDIGRIVGATYRVAF
ncbi:MAG: TonB-dependent receptor plug domain-containing protein [Campylobacterales bacterium]|nr:TonB-dependent receptor plug domain-containing protein [Campylobacterales bacterium]